MEVKHLPIYYKNKLKELNNDFKVNINELSNAYVFTNTYPSMSTWADAYSKDEGSMNQTRTDLFLLRDYLEQDINAVNKNSKNIMIKIDKLEKDNSRILAKLNNLKNSSDGAIGLFEDSQETYNFQLLENWLLSISSLFVCFLIYKNKTKNK